MPSKYPSTFYRVSVKALVRNDQGHVLVCKENSDNWSLPGGGIDHGEDVLTALSRELQEELGVSGILTAKPSSVATFYVDGLSAWLMWAVYEATLESHAFTPGPGVTDIAFMDVETFKDSL